MRCSGSAHPIEYGTHVTSSGDGDGAQPIDPDFASLFRPEEEPGRVGSPGASQPHEPDAAPASPAVERSPQPADREMMEMAPSAEEVGAEAVPAPSPSAPPPPESPVDTGRLFRSQGVKDHPDAVLALSSDHFGRLRTLKRDQDAPAAAPAPARATVSEAALEESAHVPLPAPVPVVDALPADAEPDDQRPALSRRRSGLGQGRTIKAGAVYLIVIGVTLLVGFANALISGGEIGWPTGVALLISSVYAALTVRRQDDTVAFLVPPVAFLLTALTAGQVFIDSLEGSLLNRAVILFFTLADNWIWIIGSTVIALVIVLVRRRRR